LSDSTNNDGIDVEKLTDSHGRFWIGPSAQGKVLFLQDLIEGFSFNHREGSIFDKFGDQHTGDTLADIVASYPTLHRTVLKRQNCDSALAAVGKCRRCEKTA